MSDPISQLDPELDALHSDKSWLLRLVIEEDHDRLHQYTPQSDFSMVVDDFPVLLCEVCSDASETDKTCMLLQASCLVRLGTALAGDSTFFVKAIYINDNYTATKYTLFQGTDPVSIPLIVE